MTKLEEIEVQNIKLQKQIDLLTTLLTQISASHNEIVKNVKSQATVTLHNNKRLDTIESFMTALQEEVMPEPDKIIH